jgi:FKBP-type peptidyl-prolyl cis-trans isomerase
VESGLHEGVQLLSPGDSAILVIPSYRAHGLIGDQDRIPMRSSVVYRVGLVKLSRKDP